MATLNEYLQALKMYRFEDGEDIHELSQRLSAAELAQPARMDIQVAIRQELPSFLWIKLLTPDGQELFRFGRRITHHLTTREAIDAAIERWQARGGTIVYHERPDDLSKEDK
jgi:hypothetical protein